MEARGGRQGLYITLSETVNEVLLLAQVARLDMDDNRLFGNGGRDESAPNRTVLAARLAKSSLVKLCAGYLIW